MMENARATAIGYRRGPSVGPSSRSEGIGIGTIGGMPEKSFAGWGGRFRDAHVQAEGTGYLKPRTLSRGSMVGAPKVDAFVHKAKVAKRAFDMTHGGSVGSSLEKMNKLLRLNRMF
jgi:hypothetical protein